MKVGLVLEGGGLRGMYTAGVLDVMSEHQFQPDVICGTSAGALFGVNLPSKQPGRAIRYNVRFMNDPRYIGVGSLLRTGDIINTDFAYRRVPFEFDPFDFETFRQSPTQFYATVTNIHTAQAEYLLVKDLETQMDILRASGSLPFLSRPVEWKGQHYLDGGIVDNIPLTFCQSLGCDRIIVVLTRPRGYHKNDHLSLLSRLFYPRLRGLQKAFDVRNENYHKRLAEIDQLEQAGDILVLRPSENRPVARLEKDINRMHALHQLALDDTHRRWSDIEHYLQ